MRQKDLKSEAPKLKENTHKSGILLPHSAYKNQARSPIVFSENEPAPS